MQTFIRYTFLFSTVVKEKKTVFTRTDNLWQIPGRLPFSYIANVCLRRVLSKYYTHLTNRKIKFRGIKLYLWNYTDVKQWGWKLNLVLWESKVHALSTPLQIDKMPFCSTNQFLMSLLSVNHFCRAYTTHSPSMGLIKSNV